MTRYATIKDLRRNISPDVRIVEDAAATEVRDMLLQGAAGMMAAAASLDADPDYTAPSRTPEHLALLNAGALGGAVPLEHDEQAALFTWAELQEAAHPELRNLFAVPNGGARHPAVAAQLKAEGVRRGVPDVFLAVMRRGNDGRTWGGLFVEMKRKPNKPTPEQEEWIARLRASGYMAVVCYGAQEAEQCIMAYLVQEGLP